MTNAEWMIKNGYKFSDIQCCYELDKTVTFLLNGAIAGKASYDNTCLNTFKAWLDMEHKEPILDDAERRYLSAVIKPFREKVDFIAKSEMAGTPDCSYIYIHFTCETDDMYFPSFRNRNMYKGMEKHKKYTPDELGL